MEDVGNIAVDVMDVLVRLAVVFVSVVAIPWINSKWKREQLEQLEGAALMAVGTVEQIYKAYHPEWNREKRFEEAKWRLQAWMEGKLGVDLPEARVNELIEGAVFQMNAQRASLVGESPEVTVDPHFDSGM